MPELSDGEITNFLVILLCVIVLLIYKKTKSYASARGVVLFIVFAILAFIKFKTVVNPTLLGFRLDNFEATIFPTILFVVLGTAFLYSMRIKTQKFKVVKWLMSLASLYLVFGIAQQTFFQSIFTHSLNTLLGNQVLAVLLSGIFFASFHLKKGTRGIRFGIMALLGGFVMSYLFLSSPNIILLGVSHAFLASGYYFWVNDENNLERRLKLEHARTS